MTGDLETCKIKFFMILCLPKYYSRESSQGGCKSGCDFSGGKGDVYRVWVGKPERRGLIGTDKPRWEKTKIISKKFG